MTSTGKDVNGTISGEIRCGPIPNGSSTLNP
jgi:hypothetical protein